MRWIAVVAICLVSASARAEDWGVRRDPFDAGVVRRYKAILERDPHDSGALDALVTMYKRFRTIAKLESEYRVQLDASESWPTLVVLARLPRTSRTDTVALWNRALRANQNDGRGWLAFGDLAADATAARDAYRHAAQHAGSTRDKRAALRKLVGAARSAGDARTVDTSYAELIALAPKDGLLWLERGDAQVTGGNLADAIDSFTTAESLLGTDPERRVTAMMSLGIVYERLDRTDDAIAQYLRTLDKLPRGYFLGREIVPRIIGAERRRGKLDAAIALFEKRWPERSRGYFEWATLGDLYKEARDDGRALAAYERAVAKAPTEIDTWRKVIALLDRFHPSEALAKHEAAARIAPGDANLQIDLAKRYYPMDRKKALATLDRLGKRMSKNINVRRTLAELYSQWEQPDRMIREYEAIATIEPHVPDHAIVLGDAYWQADNSVKARAAWQRLATIGTPIALFRLGEVLAMHELWDDAVVAYTKSLALDGTKPETWRGRARVYDTLERYPDAVADAQRAVALVGLAAHDRGDIERTLLVRALGHWQNADAGARFPHTVARWRFAFERGDIGAGYLLAAHHARIGSSQRHDVLVELYRRVPTDDALGIEVARSFSRRKEFSRAREELERIAQRTPARTEDIGKLLVQLEADRKQAEQEARWAEEGISARERARRIAAGHAPDLVGTRRRFGARLSLGTDVRHASSAMLGLGLYRTHRVAAGTAIPARLEWTQRDDPMEEVNAVAASVGIARRILDAHRFELAAGIAPRFELRYGSDTSSTSWNRVGLGGDVSLEMLPRAVPVTVGVRFHQSFTDPTRPSSLVVELGFEVR
jgi:tetratricopeptide (TPR) repeat protein